nr:MAG TPA: hypothetical protein [Caudoviricetes sp.]
MHKLKINNWSYLTVIIYALDYLMDGRVYWNILGSLTNTNTIFKGAVNGNVRSSP